MPRRARLQKDRPASGAGYALEGELLARAEEVAEAVAAYRTALARQQVPVARRCASTRSCSRWASRTRQRALVAEVGQGPSEGRRGADLPRRSRASPTATTRRRRRYFRAALEIEPDNVRVLNNLAWALAELKDAKALGYAERAYRLAPNSPEVVNTYGWVLVQRGDTGRGLELLRKAVDLAPADADKRLRLARGTHQERRQGGRPQDRARNRSQDGVRTGTDPGGATAQGPLIRGASRSAVRLR